MAWTSDEPFQSLSLTGGGYRGLFTARVLDAIEQEARVPIATRFDLLAGTSIGGIIALAAAFEVPMNKVVQVFLEDGAAIFPPQRNAPPKGIPRLWDYVSHWRKARYDPEPLRAAINKLIDPAATLGDAKHPVIVPAVNVTQGRMQVFKTRHVAEWTRDWKFRAADVALATAAAPTFFPLAEVAGSRYADGGLFANAPDLLVAHEAEFFFNVPPPRHRILSIGTTTRSYSISFKAGRDLGIGDWVENQRLLSVMISAQQQLADQVVAHRFQSNYCRIDHEPSQEQAVDLGLDLATDEAAQTLLALASKSATDHMHRVMPFLGCESKLQIHRGD